MGERKLVSRGIAIILGVLCIILLAGTVGAVIYHNNYASTHSHTDADYSLLASQLATANATISSLNSQLSNLQSELSSNSTQLTDLTKQIANLKAQIVNTNKTLTTLEDYYNSLMYVLNTDNHDLSVELTNANSQVTSLQNQVNSLNAIVNLSASTIWVDNQTVSQSAGGYTTWFESADYAGYVSIAVLSSTTSSTYANVTYSSHGVNYSVQTNVGTSGTAYFPILPASNITIAVGNGLLSGSATETITITYYY